MNRAPNRRIALAHDWLVGLRGGERVLDRLAHLFGPTDIYTLVQNGLPLTDAIARCTVITSRLQHLPGAAGKWRRHYLPLMPSAVRGLRVQPCDLLISTSSAVMKSIRPPTGVPHLCYCHAPARYIWDQTGDYGHGSGALTRVIGLNMVRSRFQRWDRKTAAGVTKFLANSRHTAERIKRCYDRDAEVLYPPVRTEFFAPDERTPREDWLLVVSALEPYKRVDVAIEACNRARLPLKVVGAGTQERLLRAAAGPSVQMLGRVDDQSLRNLYRRARALIFPQVEDFGIIAAEAQACGCPVIAFAGGGAMEILSDRTSVFFHEQSADSLLEAIGRLDAARIDPCDCRARALRFSESSFDAAMVRIVNEMLAPA